RMEQLVLWICRERLAGRIEWVPQRQAMPLGKQACRGPLEREVEGGDVVAGENLAGQERFPEQEYESGDQDQGVEREARRLALGGRSRPRSVVHSGAPL